MTDDIMETAFVNETARMVMAAAARYGRLTTANPDMIARKAYEWADALNLERRCRRAREASPVL